MAEVRKEGQVVPNCMEVVNLRVVKQDRSSASQRWWLASFGGEPRCAYLVESRHWGRAHHQGYPNHGVAVKPISVRHHNNPCNSKYSSHDLVGDKQRKRVLLASPQQGETRGQLYTRGTSASPAPVLRQETSSSPRQVSTELMLPLLAASLAKREVSL